MTLIADRVIQHLRRAGVQRLFGMPGGGSPADLIEAAARAGLPFTLAHTETAAAFMASAQAEITGKPGACLATLGPGATALMNGVANAYLDRIPLIAITDRHSAAVERVMQHQTLPQTDLFAPITKWNGRLTVDDAERALQGAMQAATSLPPGPVHLDISADVTDALAASAAPPPAALDRAPAPSVSALTPTLETALRGARRPLVLVGLGARALPIALAIRALCERHGLPALVTYKAKGVVPDHHPWFGGVLTNGALERPLMAQADMLIAVGLDPVELLPRPWTFPQQVVSVSAWQLQQVQVPFAVDLVGDVVGWLEVIASLLRAQCDWDTAEVARAAQTQREAMRPTAEADRLVPHRVVEIAAQAWPGMRATVDAGAHMFPVMALWPAREPNGILISNGLATMGFALPAAIGAALLEPVQPVAAFTGDGGLLMCLGELRTAARENLPLRVVVFDDGNLSLIRIKQVQRGYHTDGVSLGAVDWVALGGSLGLTAFRARDESQLARCLSEAATIPGPALIAAEIDPQTYGPTMKALRG